MIFVDLTNPRILLLLLTATVLLIFLGKEIKKPYIPALALVAFLILLVIHTIQLFMPDLANIQAAAKYSIVLDLIMVFVTFFSYLWIDDIACKEYNKKSLDNSLDWFWSKI